MLARLDEIDGVERTQANHAGTLVCVLLNASTEKRQVADAVLRVLTEEKRAPVRLAGADLHQALAKEQWRDASQVGELFAIEFRTLVARRVKAFAKSEQLSTELAEQLVKVAEDVFDEFAETATDLTNEQADAATWANRRAKFASALVERAKQLLPDEQLERLRKAMTVQRRNQRRNDANLTDDDTLPGGS